MGHISLKFLVLSVFLFLIIKVQAESHCDTTYNYEFIEKNDSTIELRISINGRNCKVEYFKAKSEDNVSLPKFQGRYKDCLIFMIGNGQHFRLLIVFQVSNDKIIREEYEHTICMEPDEKESYLFFYEGQPIKMIYNYKNSKVKFKKLCNRKKYLKFKGKTIESCHNKFYTE